MNKFDYTCLIESAIGTGEIICDKLPGNKVSITDEIKKLKELQDAGAITQEEYTEQKKKLLNQ